MFLVPCLFVLVPCPFVLVPTPYSLYPLFLLFQSLWSRSFIPCTQYTQSLVPNPNAVFFCQKKFTRTCKLLGNQFFGIFSIFVSFCIPPTLSVLPLFSPLSPSPPGAPFAHPPPLLQGLNSPFVYSRISLYEYKGICLGMQGLHMHILSSVSKYRVSHGKIKFYIIYNTSYIVFLDKCFLKTILRVNICDYIAAQFLYKLRQLQRIQYI